MFGSLRVRSLELRVGWSRSASLLVSGLDFRDLRFRVSEGN